MKTFKDIKAEELNALPIEELVKVLDISPCTSEKLSYETVVKLPRNVVEYLSKKHRDIAGWLTVV